MTDRGPDSSSEKPPAPSTASDKGRGAPPEKGRGRSVSLAWSSPCDVIVRRHPKGGYIFSIVGSGPHATLAHGFHGFAQYLTSKTSTAEGALDYPPWTNPPLSYELASNLVETMHGVNLLVDDKVLKIDQRVKQWGRVLPSVIVFGGLAAAIFTEGQRWSLLSTAIILLIGLTVGGWLRHQYEQDGTFLPSPTAAAGGLAAVVLAIVAFGAWVSGTVWARKKLGGWGVALFAVLSMGVIIAVVILVEQIRLRWQKKLDLEKSDKSP